MLCRLCWLPNHFESFCHVYDFICCLARDVLSGLVTVLFLHKHIKKNGEEQKSNITEIDKVGIEASIDDDISGKLPCFSFLFPQINGNDFKQRNNIYCMNIGYSQIFKHSFLMFVRGSCKAIELKSN
ncbi:CLUMA_CG008243, isoform A [Clunio marinus]|uniref:CLUMA_CG008243, isoform A n=1 Tax=Clunio marinus TaxID=568069 RepID=A0A1J1I323_9DIPT|nr:CLUMA_CG008243, isoform A [Clunio marinus]